MVSTHGYNLRSTCHLNTDNISEIIPKKLYLGNKIAAQDAALLNQIGITHILNATKEVDCHFPHAFTYLRIGISDGDPELSKYLDEAISFIKAGKVVFVHCAQGISRSASLVIGYLMQIKECDYELSYALVKEKRPAIAPHFFFQLALSEN